MASRKVLPIDGAVTFVVVVVFLVPSVLAAFKENFMTTCLKFEETRANCDVAWTLFEKGHEKKDPEKVKKEDYKPLFDRFAFTHPCKKTLLYSRVRDEVKKLVGKGDCYLTVGDTMLGSMIGGARWCGKENKLGTFTEGCGKNNPSAVFWQIASARFAEYACDNVTVLLNGELPVPYDLTSYFAEYEVPNLQPSKVKKLHVILSVKTKGTKCNNESLKKLEDGLKKGIKYVCEEVLKSELEKCEHAKSADGVCQCQQLFKL